MTPTDALWQAMQSILVSSRAMRPGMIILTLPKGLRDALEKLTSEDTLKMRFDQ